jgi:hypothetical protein
MDEGLPWKTRILRYLPAGRYGQAYLLGCTWWRTAALCPYFQSLVYPILGLFAACMR